MLVLTRKIGQQVLIGKGLIQMKVLRIDDDVISIGFQAPSHIDIDREEVHLRKAAKEAGFFNKGVLGL